MAETVEHLEEGIKERNLAYRSPGNEGSSFDKVFQKGGATLEFHQETDRSFSQNSINSEKC